MLPASTWGRNLQTEVAVVGAQTVATVGATTVTVALATPATKPTPASTVSKVGLKLFEVGFTET